jgi:uncharacterized protein (TIGR02231 family)
MRSPIAPVTAFALAMVAALSTAAQAAEIKTPSRIDAVTVYPTGAQVTRVGKVKLERGDHVIVFNDLPSNAVGSSLRVEGKATGRLEIGSVDSRRLFVARTDDAVAASERKRIEDAIEKLKDERAQLQVAIEAAEAQKKLINNLAQLPAQPPAPNATAAPQPDWSQLFALIGQRIGEAQKVVLDAQIKIRDTDRRITDLEKTLVSLAPAQDERTEVKVFVAAETPLEADIVMRYQVVNASWIPLYDARLMTGSKAQPPKLQLVRRASIQQRSGEIWDDVVLSLSTARPGAGTAAPLLNTETVDFEPEAPLPRPQPVAMAPRSIGAASPDRLAAAEGGDKAKVAAHSAGLPAMESQATIETQAFQALYGISGRVTVPATGEVKRVQIDDMQLDPALTARTVPKRDEKAYLYAKITIARGTPILPGQVALFRDSTFVGNGRLPQLAPGEEHELGFGVLDSVRVHHAIAEETRSESGIISSSKTDTRNYRITVKSLHERALAVTVLDQLPVSQNADIKVELIGKTAPTKRDLDDKRGVLAWELKLEPDEEKIIEFGYRVTWPAAKRVVYGN